MTKSPAILKTNSKVNKLWIHSTSFLIEFLKINFLYVWNADSNYRCIYLKPWCLRLPIYYKDTKMMVEKIVCMIYEVKTVHM